MDDLLIQLVNLSKIRPSGCLEYQGQRTTGGYGYFAANGHHWVASRLAYQLTFGEIPLGKQVCHHCDNRLCINPMHLFIGTAWDNMQDQKRKGRYRKQQNEANANAKLNWETVREIRKQLNNGWSMASIAKQFGVSRSCIEHIRYNHSWKEES